MTMKKICLVVFSIIISFNSLLCLEEATIYTIIAPSGLSLRSEPNLDSDRILIIPFGEQVTVDETQGDLFISSNKDTIDSRFGYWLPVTYENKKGYLFSAYLKYGYLLVPETEINNEFRIVMSGIRCDPLNYDPDMYWYAFKLNEDRDDFDVVPVSPKMNFDLNFGEGEEEFMYVGMGDFVELDTGLKDDINDFYLMLGSKKPLNIKALKEGLSFFDKNNHYMGFHGKSIYPYQQFRISNDKSNVFYQFSGEEKIEIIDNQNRDTYVQRIYQLNFYPYQDGLESSQMNLTELLNPVELEYVEQGAQYDVHQHPRLFWSGDVNGDGLLDFIFYRTNYYESCGGNEAYFLITSSKENGVIRYKKAAMDTVNACFGC